MATMRNGGVPGSEFTVPAVSPTVKVRVYASRELARGLRARSSAATEIEPHSTNDLERRAPGAGQIGNGRA